MSATKDEKTDAIFDDLLDLELEVMTSVSALINADWDAPTLRTEVEELIKQRTSLYNELDLLEKKK